MELWSIKKWSKALAPTFNLDTGTFLLTSIIPLSYMDEVNGEHLQIVDLVELRKLTNFSKQGCDKLVELGYAKWVSEGGKMDYERIALGTSTNYINVNYYFDKKERVSAEIGTTVLDANKTDKVDISDTVAKLDAWYERYSAYCEKVRKGSAAEKVHEKLRNILRSVKTKGTFTIPELLGYLDCCNAMFYDWTDIPNNYKSMPMRTTATKVLSKTTAANLVKIVPYYVEHYPKTAKEGYETTNIYSLDFHFTTMLSKAIPKKTTSNISAKDDEL